MSILEVSVMSNLKTTKNPTANIKKLWYKKKSWNREIKSLVDESSNLPFSKIKASEMLSLLMYCVAKLAQMKIENEIPVKQAEINRFVLIGYRQDITYVVKTQIDWSKMPNVIIQLNNNTIFWLQNMARQQM